MTLYLIVPLSSIKLETTPIFFSMIAFGEHLISTLNWSSTWFHGSLWLAFKKTLCFLFQCFQFVDFKHNRIDVHVYILHQLFGRIIRFRIHFLPQGTKLEIMLRHLHPGLEWFVSLFSHPRFYWFSLSYPSQNVWNPRCTVDEW